MATMIPDDIEDFTTDGEKVFYRFLSAVAKPDERYVGWYAPEVSESEPDFILYCGEAGLVVFEVKDWRIEQIQEANPKKFRVAFGDGKLVSVTNPHEQARGYLFKILDCLAKDGKLVNRDGATAGKPKVPVSIGVVFPNINAMEYRDRFGDSVIPIGKIFFWDDVNHYSDLYEPTGQRFAEVIRTRFEPKFPCRLSGGELNHLRQLLFPSIRIQTVDRGPSQAQQDHDRTVSLLDHHQEVIARKFDRGHRIVSGPSGSGKTLVLVHQAVFLLKYNRAVKRILLLCYNAALVNYIRRLLALQGAPLGPQGVEVLTFYELCARLTGEQVLHEHQDQAYYDLVLDLALGQEPGPDKMFDAVLVDEGQDFSDRMLQVVMKCLNRSTDILTIALDEGQEVYRTKRVWGQVGIHARGRMKRLDMVYRNTVEIARFAARFRGEEAPQPETGGMQQMRLFPDPRAVSGPRPELVKADTLGEVVDGVAERIRGLSASGAYPLSEIAILYTTKNPAPGQGVTDLYSDTETESRDTTKNPAPGQGAALPQMLAEALDQRGILNKWLAEDYRAKRTHDITASSVTISTIHSVKGLDFACVFLLGLDAFPDDERWAEEQIDHLTY